MRTNYIILFEVLFLVILIGCNPINNEYIKINNALIVDDASFKNSRRLSSEIFNDSFISAPVRLSLIDSILFAVDPINKSDSLVRLFSTINRNYYGAYLIRGNGRNEVLSVDRINKSIKDETLWVFDLTANKWLGYNSQNIFNNGLKEADSIIYFNEISLNNIHNPLWTTDGILAPELNKYEERFLIYTDSNQVKRVKNNQLEFDNRLSDAVLSDIFSRHICYNKKGKKVILASKYINMIEIFSENGEIEKTIICPNSNMEIKFDKERSMQNGAFFKSPETRRSFLKVVSSLDKIYALYSGKLKENSNNYSFSNIVYVFDLSGNPIEKIVLEDDTSDIEVDSNNNFLYAIKSNPEPVIIYYKL